MTTTIDIDDLNKQLCEEVIPSGFNLYEWADANPDTAIAQSVYRLEKIFDNADEIFFGFSGGKDSTLTAQLSVLELKRRWKRVENNVKRDGSKGIDPLDEKWVGKKLNGNTMDGEWIWTDAIDHVVDFTAKHGPGVYEINGRRFSGADLHITESGEVLTTREIYKIVEDGGEVEVMDHV